MKRWTLRIFGTLAALLALLVVAVWLTTFHPADLQAEPVACPPDAPRLQAGQQIKIMTWNVQFMAGKNYVFFSDLPDGNAPDERPSPEDITKSIEGVARVIRDEHPDVVLLQEVDNGAARTDYEDQLARLLTLLPPEYACHTTAFYWKAAYVPHPRIHGAAGMMLAIVSRYQIDSAQRRQLALVPRDLLSQQFNIKRAILEAHMPVDGGGSFVALDTHLDAFAQGSDTMERQVAQVDGVLADLTGAGASWAIGGDFNLLPPDDMAFKRLTAGHQTFYNPSSEIKPLYDHYKVVPTLSEVTGPDYIRWFTYFPNDPSIGYPDRTLDYLFFAPSVAVGEHYVRQGDTLTLSDHMPLIAELQLTR
jgi:endonuclease/exonuclease/phosphatase family metal-dependent hydrolase